MRAKIRNMTTVKQRSAALDALRVVGIIAIVAGHVWDNQFVRELLYTWHVPLFFVLSGYLWTRGRTVSVEASNRWRTIGLPYVAWLIIIAIPFLAVTALNSDNVLEQAIRVVLGGAYIGRPFSAFWFMTALIIACVLFRWLERFPRPVAWGVAAVGVLACTVAPSIVNKAPLAAGVAVAALAFIITGQLLRDYRDRIRHPVLLALALLIVSVVLISTGISRPLDMKQADLGTPGLSVLVAAAICTAFVLLFEGLFAGRSGAFPSVVIELAVVGTTVVLTHAVVLWVLATPPNGTWVDFALALVIPWGAALIFVRTPLARLLVGSPQRAVTARDRSKR